MLGEIARRSNRKRASGGGKWRRVTRTLNNCLCLARTIQPIRLECLRLLHRAREQSTPQMNHPSLFPIRRPGQTHARRKVRKGSGRSLQCIAQPCGDRHLRRKLSGILRIQRKPPLRERHERVATRNVIDGDVSPGRPSSAAILLKPSDHDASASVKTGSHASAENERTNQHPCR